MNETIAPRNRLLHILKIICGIFFVISLPLASGFTTYYFFLRTPDSAYSSAIKDLEYMKASAIHIREASGKTQVLSKDLVQQYETVRDDANIYVASLDSLVTNVAFKNDAQVQAAYKPASSVIKPYGQATLDMINTAKGFFEVSSTCRPALKKAYSGTSQSVFNKIMEPCRSLLERYPSFSAPSFTQWYDTYRAALEDLFDDTDEYFEIAKSGDATQVLSANLAVQKRVLEYSDVMKKVPPISNGTGPESNPAEKIDSLISSLKNRRDMLFRH